MLFIEASKRSEGNEDIFREECEKILEDLRAEYKDEI